MYFGLLARNPEVMEHCIQSNIRTAPPRLPSLHLANQIDFEPLPIRMRRSIARCDCPFTKSTESRSGLHLSRLRRGSQFASVDIDPVGECRFVNVAATDHDHQISVAAQVRLAAQ